jgi:hypothetical protein
MTPESSPFTLNWFGRFSAQDEPMQLPSEVMKTKNKLCIPLTISQFPGLIRSLLEQLLLYWKQVIPLWIHQTQNGSRTDQVSARPFEENNMKFFRNFLMILASVALLTGCPTDEPSNGSQDTSAQVDGGGNDNDIGGKDTPTGGWEDIKLHPTEGYVAVEITTPDGKPADFYICLGGCGSYDKLPEVNEYTVLEKNTVKLQHFTKAPIKGKGIEMQIRIVRQNYLFIDWSFFAKGNPDTNWTNSYTHEWKDTGSWGKLPACQSVIDSADGKKKNITSGVKNGKVTLTVGNSEFAWLTGDKLVETSNDATAGFKVSGTVSEDQSVIKYVITLGSDTQEGTLTCQ